MNHIEMVSKLAERFSATPKVESCRVDSTRSRFRPWTNTIYLTRRADDHTVLHEYAHALVHHRNKNIPWNEQDRRHHGKVFKRTLAEIVRFWYGSYSGYNWNQEYRSVGKFGKKLVQSESNVSRTNPIVRVVNIQNKDKENMITIDHGYVLPEKVRRGKKEQYPFSTMTVTTKDTAGDSFFVANSDTPQGNAVKTLQRTAYSAEKRIEKATGNSVRFAVFPATVTVDGETVEGARVFRTE